MWGRSDWFPQVRPSWFPWVQSFMYDIGIKTLMSKYIDHGRTFSDTHSKIPPAIDISRKIPIVLARLQPPKSNLPKTILGFTVNVFVIFSSLFDKLHFGNM